MVKIKQKKQLNLPQLIEWGFDNDVRNKYFLTHDSEGNVSEMSFDIRGLPKFSSVVDKSDTFTVEVEEEITEDTMIDELVELYEDYLESNEILKHENRSISEAKDEDGCASQAFYIIYDDLTMTLIWTREKGLVN